MQRTSKGFQFYPRSTNPPWTIPAETDKRLSILSKINVQEMVIIYHINMLNLSILSKINVYFRVQGGSSYSQAFNSIQDQLVHANILYVWQNRTFNSIQDQPEEMRSCNQWCWHLSILSKINLRFWRRSGLLLWRSFNSIQDQLHMIERVSNRWKILSILSKINKIYHFIENNKEMNSFNSIQDQPDPRGNSNTLRTVYFQFYPRSTRTTRTNWIRYIHVLSILSKINMWWKMNYTWTIINTFNSIQDQLEYIL